MIKKLLIGAVVGAILQFVWGGISYMAIPWHKMTMESFKDEAAMAKAITANAPAAGIYVLPNPNPHDAPTDPAAVKAAHDKAQAMWTSGPVVFAAVSGGTNPDMKYQFGGALCIGALGGFLMTWLLLSVGLPGYWQRARFVSTVALTAGVLVHLPYFNWWGFPMMYTKVQVADLFIGWTITGMALAKLTGGGKKKK
jgi:hypothetical protein